MSQIRGLVCLLSQHGGENFIYCVSEDGFLEDLGDIFMGIWSSDRLRQLMDFLLGQAMDSDL
jgi:hypothetical protein